MEQSFPSFRPLFGGTHPRSRISISYLRVPYRLAQLFWVSYRPAQLFSVLFSMAITKKTPRSRNCRLRSPSHYRANLEKPIENLQKARAPETEVRLSRAADKWERYAQAMFCNADDHADLFMLSKSFLAFLGEDVNDAWNILCTCTIQLYEQFLRWRIDEGGIKRLSSLTTEWKYICMLHRVKCNNKNMDGTTEKHIKQVCWLFYSISSTRLM